MKNLLQQLLKDKKVLILGYGREGKSTFRLLRSYFPDVQLSVSDSNQRLAEENEELRAENITVFSGQDYLKNINHFDLIIKSPGISLYKLGIDISPEKITSQTDIFLQAYASQICGITGTKGKSTTSSLLHHITSCYSSNTLFAGNIGIPLFDLISKIDHGTRIICELSSHQLEHISVAPHIGVLLNIFQEHLDHYSSYKAYQLSKLKIGQKQANVDYFLTSANDTVINSLLKEYTLPSQVLPATLSELTGIGAGLVNDYYTLKTQKNSFRLFPAKLEISLHGKHNRLNAIIAASSAALSGIPEEAIIEGLQSFKPLRHRIEFAGVFNNKKFYNDSISTIPEATLAAIETLQPVHTLILGGFDRGIEYSAFINQISKSSIRYIVFTGPAGERMFRILKSVNHTGAPFYEMAPDFETAVLQAIKNTPKGEKCLLSPAASSYDRFNNFEERGDFFCELVSKQK